jgi:two-component system response regulator
MWTKAGRFVICGFAVIKLLLGGSARARTDVEMTIEALQGISNRIQVAWDGLEALDFLFCEGAHANPPSDHLSQLILLDLGLPKIPGLEVLRRVKSDSRTASIPVVVMTESKDDQDLRMSRRPGAEACIVKPVGLPGLTRVTPQLNIRWAMLKKAA